MPSSGPIRAADRFLSGDSAPTRRDPQSPSRRLARPPGPLGRPRYRPADELSDARLGQHARQADRRPKLHKVTAHCQQVLAGIGFTSEHPFHRFMKRAVVLERILGDTGLLTESVGRQLAALGEAPRVVDL